SLSAFLRDYVYIPLGGSRKGPLRRYGNLMATMVLGGLWHGAGWAFLAWGFLHGLYLVINHGWRKVTASFSPAWNACLKPFAWTLTFLAVVAAWVPFRLENLGAAVQVLKAMFGFKGVTLPDTWGGAAFHAPLQALGVSLSEIFPLDPQGWPFWPWLLVCGGIAFLMPNSRSIIEKFGAWMSALPASKGRSVAAFACGVLVALSLLLVIVSSGRGASEFLYFNF
ncbi:MAG TPA: MBOAT family O-acyltransferase, partial [Fibrobacteria bacterium]|nr:MBOAT family O-acyltransferase [Fibrobacteria bacterium]